MHIFKRAIFLFCAAFFVFVILSNDIYARRLMTVSIGKDEAKVTFLQGTASVISGGDSQKHPLRIGDTLKGGDQVNTGPRSKLEIVLINKTKIRFANNTRFKISQIGCNEKSKIEYVRVRLLLGRTWANVNKTVGAKTDFALSCENAVAGVRGTVYRMNVNDDKSVLVRVYDGVVSVTGGDVAVVEPPKKVGSPHRIAGPRVVTGPEKVTMEEWTYILKSMQQVNIRGDGTAEEPRDFTLEEDKNEWVDWNRSRDEL